MKQLFLQRHAKSDWSNQNLNDFERPLNARGQGDLTVMGPVLAELNIAPDQIISSPAVRAITTAQALAAYVGYPIENIVEDDTLYSADFSVLMRIIQTLDDNKAAIMLIGHNPHLSLIAAYLCDDAKYELPTCGVYGLQFSTEHWADIGQHSGQLQCLEFPKRHRR